MSAAHLQGLLAIDVLWLIVVDIVAGCDVGV
jgi:hypothetical protein